MELKSPVIIIVSELDLAGTNMRDALFRHLNFSEPEMIDVPQSWPEGSYTVAHAGDVMLFNIPGSHIMIDYMQDNLKADLLIFASKHSSATGKKTLLAHPLGNWGEDTIGSGKSKSLGIAPPHALHLALHSLVKYQSKLGLDDYWTGLEVSHHGPTELKVPAIFMEAGGSESEWKDLVATDAVAQAIVDVANGYLDHEIPDVGYIGIGGGHYAPTFIRRSLNDGLMFGHMAPKHHAVNLDFNMLKMAADRTLGENKIFLLDKKGLKGADRRRIIEDLETLGFDFIVGKH